MLLILVIKLQKEPTSGSKKYSTLLSATDPDSWVGQRVLIISGRFMGEIATVRSSGNGWVQVEALSGEIAKRAYELELVPVNEEAETLSRINRKRGRNDRVDMFSPATSSSSSKGDKYIDGERLNDKNLNSDGRMSETPLTDSENRSDLTQSDLRNREKELEQRMDRLERNVRLERLETRLEKSARLDRVNKRSRTSTGSVVNSNVESGTIHTTENSSVVSAEQDSSTKVSCPLIQQKFIDMKRSFVMKFVEKTTQTFGKRPNLQEWKVKINNALFQHADREYEYEASRLFDESFCSVCCLERWPNSKFCWNEWCPSSPIYYKLTGADVTTISSPQFPKSFQSIDDYVNQISQDDQKNESVSSMSVNAFPLASNQNNKLTVQLWDTKIKDEGSLGLSGSTKTETVDDYVETNLSISNESKDFSDAVTFPKRLSLNPVTDYLLDAPAVLISNDSTGSTTPMS